MLEMYDIQVTHIERIDLNLLAPLAALLEERHVSRAAQRVSLSQPAMSRALQRLRETLDDELLVRSGNGYQLTPRAQRLQRQLETILPELEALFTEPVFDPAQATETFRVAGTDYPAIAFGPPLFQQVFRASPGSRLVFRAWNDQVFEDVEHGLTDLAFAAGTGPAGLRSQPLIDDTFVCLMSADHPLASRSRLSTPEYLDCSHVEVAVVAGHQTLIDRRLAAPRSVSLSVPYHSAAPLSVRGTHLVATLPWRLVAQYATDPTMCIVAAPAEIEPLNYLMVWHPRLDDDPAQRWLRATVHSTISDLPEPPLPAAIVRHSRAL